LFGVVQNANFILDPNLWHEGEGLSLENKYFID
jgi:hypothetical protein